VHKLKDRSIRYTFMLYIIITLLLCTIVLSAVIGVNESGVLNKSLENKGKSLASYIALISQDGYSDEVGRLFRRKSAGHSDEVGHPLRGCAAG